MRTFRLVIAVLGVAFVVGVAGSVFASFDARTVNTIISRGDYAAKQTHRVGIADSVHPNEQGRVVACPQVIVNPQLNVVELGPNTGAAEPWFFLEPIIYFLKEGDGSGLAYDGYSLILPDGDVGDPSPQSDILSQIVALGPELVSVTVSYQHLTLDSNPQDNAFGELWLLTADGDIDLTNPAQYRAARWEISESEDVWSKQTVEVSEAALAKLAGQDIALLLRTVTDGGGPTEADKEWVLFDDVTITACSSSDNMGGTIYLPAILRN